TGSRFAIAAMLLLAAAVRVWGLRFGLPYAYARPDETALAGDAVKFLSGDLRPSFFQWPTLFMYTVAVVYVVYFIVTRPFSSYGSLAAFADSRYQNIAPFF